MVFFDFLRPFTLQSAPVLCRLPSPLVARILECFRQCDWCFGFKFHCNEFPIFPAREDLAVYIALQDFTEDLNVFIPCISVADIVAAGYLVSSR
jgi:hypothetical protein